MMLWKNNVKQRKGNNMKDVQKNSLSLKMNSRESIRTFQKTTQYSNQSQEKLVSMKEGDTVIMKEQATHIIR